MANTATPRPHDERVNTLEYFIYRGPDRFDIVANLIEPYTTPEERKPLRFIVRPMGHGAHEILSQLTAFITQVTRTKNISHVDNELVFSLEGTGMFDGNEEYPFRASYHLAARTGGLWIDIPAFRIPAGHFPDR